MRNNRMSLSQTDLEPLQRRIQTLLPQKLQKWFRVVVVVVEKGKYAGERYVRGLWSRIILFLHSPKTGVIMRGLASIMKERGHLHIVRF